MSSQLNVGAGPVRAAHVFDVADLQRYFASHVPEISGTLDVQQFKGGQSNPTYQLNAGGKKYVLRRKPPGNLLPSAHAVDREYRIMNALRNTDVPVPRMVCLCEDAGVIGTSFYVMENVEGRIIWDADLPDMTPESRHAHYSELNRVIAALHSVDPVSVGLADFGKPGQFVERQIGRWTKQYRASETETIEAMENLIEWLPQNVPTNAPTSLVHGDYRFDNVIFHPTEARVLAVIDWELATLGDPLADFVYHCIKYRMPGSPLLQFSDADKIANGIPTEAQYQQLYCERTGRSEIPHYDFYMAFNMFRLVGILQGVAKRGLDGNASSANAAESGKRTRPVAEAGWQQALRVING
ncbi:MAG: phosphotransferase [Candidatus Obscuribacterales bacterium]|nr:phosphotransferase [Steroidobacteraceae bacterium]